VHTLSWHAPPTHDWVTPHARQSPASAPHAKSAVPLWHWPAESRQPAHGALVHAKSWHRSPEAHATQAARRRPHASVEVPAKHCPSGPQHPNTHTHPPSELPASAGVRQPRDVHTWVAEQTAQATPPSPHSECATPSRHSPSVEQHPSQVSGPQGGA
jgi:hypothetical protein